MNGGISRVAGQVFCNGTWRVEIQNVDLRTRQRNAVGGNRLGMRGWVGWTIVQSEKGGTPTQQITSFCMATKHF